MLRGPDLRGDIAKYAKNAGKALIVTALAFATSPVIPASAAGKDISFSKGEQKPVAADCVLNGDLKIKGQEDFRDHNVLTADVVIFVDGAQVEAPDGASGKCFDRTNEALAYANEQEALKLSKGFASVRRILVFREGVSVPSDAGNCTKDHVVKPGETLRIKKGAVGKGDPNVNGEDVFDTGKGSERTGLVFETTEDVTIYAPYGANILEINPCFPGNEAARQRVIEKFIAETYASGCEDNKGCDTVSFVRVPGGRQGNTESAIARVNTQAAWNGFMNPAMSARASRRARAAA